MHGRTINTKRKSGFGTSQLSCGLMGLILMAAAGVTACGDTFTRRPAVLPVQKKDAVDWTAVLEEKNKNPPGDNPYRLGDCADIGNARPDDDRVKERADDPMEVRVFAHLIRHPDQGTF